MPHGQANRTVCPAWFATTAWVSMPFVVSARLPTAPNQCSPATMALTVPLTLVRRRCSTFDPMSGNQFTGRDLYRGTLMAAVLGLVAALVVGVQPAAAQDTFACTITNNNGTATITWNNIGARGYDLIEDNQPKRWTTTTTYTDTTPGNTYKIVAFGNGTDFTTTTCTNNNGGGGGGAPVNGAISLLAAGDIGRCDSPHLAPVGSYVESRTDAWFLALGDLAYPDGSTSDFDRCYDPHFRDAKDRTLPVVGNHEYYTSGAAGYVDYFGSSAGPADKLYYSRDLGDWHIVVLNGECWRVGGCGTGDPQYRWLQQDLASNDKACILTAWHQAYYTSESLTGDATYMKPYYELLDNEGADILLTGHSHNYERFHRMDADNSVTSTGIRSFVVGTGGTYQRPFQINHNGSVVRNNTTWGVVEFDLRDGSYNWDFRRTSGAQFSDSGYGTC